MSIRITQNTLRLRNNATGEMQPVAMFGSGADKTLEELNETATQAINEIRSAGDEIKADINDIIDPTLTVEGKAADAKVVGEKFEQLINNIESYHETALQYFIQLKELLENGGTTESAIAVLDEAILDLTVLA